MVEKLPVKYPQYCVQLRMERMTQEHRKLIEYGRPRTQNYTCLTFYRALRDAIDECRRRNRDSFP